MNTFVIIIAIALFIFFCWRFKQNKKVALKHIQAGEAFLESNRQLEGIKTTDSGLQIKQLVAGSGGEHPTASSKVKVHYHGTLIDGTVFDSSVDRGEPIEFGLNQVIKGWTEGLQLMVVGEKARLFIPYTLAYGTQSTGVIAGGSTLIFDVELLEIC